jgi:hypothetical protein
MRHLWRLGLVVSFLPVRPSAAVWAGLRQSRKREETVRTLTYFYLTCCSIVKELTYHAL